MIDSAPKSALRKSDSTRSPSTVLRSEDLETDALVREMVDATLSPSARPFFPGSDSKRPPKSELAKEGETAPAIVMDEKEEKLPD